MYCIKLKSDSASLDIIRCAYRCTVWVKPGCPCIPQPCLAEYCLQCQAPPWATSTPEAAGLCGQWERAGTTCVAWKWQHRRKPYSPSLLSSPQGLAGGGRQCVATCSGEQHQEGRGPQNDSCWEGPLCF